MLKRLIIEHRPSCMVIDPLSAITKSGQLSTARAVANRLIYAVKDERVTVMVTSISEGDDPSIEATELQISAIADTWIHLSYLVNGGERNRALTIIKSRGTWHSNQVRELSLGDDGPQLTDVYTAGGEVLMGALRWEKEREEYQQNMARRDEFERQRAQLEGAECETRARIVALQQDLAHQQSELKMLASQNEASLESSDSHKSELRRLRNADRVADSAPKPTKPRAGNGASRTNR
jgi:circadian clock protein KaiC